MKASIQQFKEAAIRFADLKAEIQQIVSTLNPIEMVTPTNLAEAKSEWIEQAKNGIFTNPTFSYNTDLLATVTQSENLLGPIYTRISSLHNEITTKYTVYTPAAFYLSYLAHVVNDAIATSLIAKAMLAQDDFKLADIVLEKYGQPNNSLITIAKLLTRKDYTHSVTQTELSTVDYQRLLNAKLDANFIAEMFAWTMQQYEQTFPAATAWPVKILDNCSAIDVRDKSSFGYPIIAVPKSRIVNGIKLAELIGHEIECHWRNSQNAALLGLLKTDDELIYEGLAKWKDYEFNSHFGTEILYPLPYYVLAEQSALNGNSFDEVARYLVESYNLPPARAWGFTYRTFRGISNCKNPSNYAFTKDRAYLEGFMYVSEVGKKDIFSFGTLNKAFLVQLENILSPSDIRRHAILDLDLQAAAIQEILHRL